MPDRWFFVQFAFHQLETWSFSKKQCEKEKKKKNVSSLQKASIGMLISCRNVEAAVLISRPIRWPIELDDRGRPLIGKLMTFRRQRINPYESRSSRFSVRSSSAAWRPSPTTFSEIISWFLNRLRWISDILAGAVYLNRPTWISMVFFHSSLSVEHRSASIHAELCTVRWDYSFFVSSSLQYTPFPCNTFSTSSHFYDIFTLVTAFYNKLSSF